MNDMNTTTKPGVLAYAVIEREGGAPVRLAYDREQAADWCAGANSEYRNQQCPGPSYRTIELVDRATVERLADAAQFVLDKEWEYGEDQPAFARLNAALADFRGEA